MPMTAAGPIACWSDQFGSLWQGQLFTESPEAGIASVPGYANKYAIGGDSGSPIFIPALQNGLPINVWIAPLKSDPDVGDDSNYATVMQEFQMMQRLDPTLTAQFAPQIADLTAYKGD